MDVTLISAVNSARANRQAVAVITEIDTGRSRLVDSNAVDQDDLSTELRSRFASGKSGLMDTSGGDIFLQVYVPSPRIVVIGAVHISQAFFPMAQACGFDVSIIDPRSAFATEDRFASVPLHDEWPQDVLLAHPLDEYTALVALTHDPKIDDYPLMAALQAGCFYVGALGSRKTHTKRCERLMADGLSPQQLERMHAPIGLDIGAANPPEIAVAVLGEIIESLRRSKQDSTIGFAA